MKENSKLLRGLLRILAALSVGLCAFAPFLAVNVSMLGYTGEREAWMLTALCAAAAVFGPGVGWLLEKSKLPPWTRDVVIAIFAVGWFIAAMLVPWKVWALGIGTGIFAGALTAVCWVIGARFAKNPPGEIWLLGFGGVALFCAVILRLSETGNAVSVQSLVWVLYCQTCFTTLCANYENIDRHMSRRGHSKARLPGHVRKNNLTALMILFAAAAVFLVLRKPFGKCLGAVIGWLMQGIVLLFRFLSTLFRTREVEGADAEDMDLSGYTAGEETGNSDIGYYILCGILIAAVVVFLIPKLADWVKRTFLSVRESVRRWFHRTARQERHHVDAGDYTDVTESVTAMETETTASVGKSAMRKWRREVRSVKSMPEGRERFIRSYGLLTEGLRLSGTQCAPGDTPSDTAQKAREIIGDMMEPVAQSAGEVSFSGREAKADIAAADRALDALREKNG